MVQRNIEEKIINKIKIFLKVIMPNFKKYFSELLQSLGEIYMVGYVKSNEKKYLYNI